MNLLVPVKAGNITNLSNARYCAGMGVELLGFPISTEEEIQKYKEISGWVSGVKLVLELPSTPINEVLLTIFIKELAPDYLEIPLALVDYYTSLTSLPFIILLNTESELFNCKPENFVLFKGDLEVHKGALLKWTKNYSLIIGGKSLNKQTILPLIEEFTPKAIELIGEEEVSAGLKSFDEFSDILELLEINE